MPKIKIIKVLNKDEVSAKGKAYIKCSIKTLDKNGLECWLNGFGNNTTKSWADGQTIELAIYQEEYNGKMQLKFKTPPETNMVELLQRIDKKLDMLIDVKNPLGLEEAVVESPDEYREGEPINVEDIPF